MIKAIKQTMLTAMLLLMRRPAPQPTRRTRSGIRWFVLELTPPRQDTEAEGTTMDGGLNTASLTLEHLAGQFMQALSLNGPHTEELKQRWSEKVQALAQASTIHGRGMQTDPQEVFGQVQDRLTKDIEAVMAILSSRLVQDVVAEQSDPVRQRLEEMIDANRRMGELVIRIAEQMGRIIQAQANPTANQVPRAA